MTIDQGAAFARERRESGRRVVFTNGVFDILHPGHLRYLQHARSLGDALILGTGLTMVDLALSPLTPIPCTTPDDGSRMPTTFSLTPIAMPIAIVGFQPEPAIEPGDSFTLDALTLRVDSAERDAADHLRRFIDPGAGPEAGMDATIGSDRHDEAHVFRAATGSQCRRCAPPGGKLRVRGLWTRADHTGSRR